MSLKLDSEREREFLDNMDQATYNLWIAIGMRLLKGQKQYGGFKFEEYDLTQMRAEELMDWVVYREAQEYLENKKGK